MNANSVGRTDVCRLTVKVLTRMDEPFGQHTVAEDLLLAVHVVEEQFQRLHALGDTRFELVPLAGRNDPWHNVQRERPLHTGE